MQKMYRPEKTLREGIRYNNRHDKEIPSFSSSLLDKIYRSIDEGEKRKSDDLKFFRETISTTRKQSRTRVMAEEEDDEELNSFRRACLIEKWMEKKVGEKVGNQRRKQYYSEFDRKLDHENDALFFSSTSSSSDSSSGGFSSSDTESIFGARSATSYSAPPRPKHVRMTVTEKKQREEVYVLDDYHRPKERRAETPKLENDDLLIKSKSRALKIYSNLKKVKQPISPGGKLAAFLNSLFTTNSKKSKTYAPATTSSYQETSTCSSASSYSRSCLSKNSEKLSNNGVKRSVRFYPVSVIVDEDSRPCGHKCLYEEKDSALMPVSVPKAWKIGRSPVRKTAEDDQLKVKHQQVLEKNRRVEETAREFLRDYHQNQTKKKDFLTQLRGDRVRDNEVIEDEEIDDAASCSSSDLFELDHLAVIGKESRYQEELPVYETTRFDKNRAILMAQ